MSTTPRLPFGRVSEELVSNDGVAETGLHACSGPGFAFSYQPSKSAAGRSTLVVVELRSVVAQTRSLVGELGLQVCAALAMFVVQPPAISARSILSAAADVSPTFEEF